MATPVISTNESSLKQEYLYIYTLDDEKRKQVLYTFLFSSFLQFYDSEKWR